MFHSTLLCSVHHFRRNSIFLLLWDFLRLRKHEIKKYLSVFLLTNKSIWWYILCNKNYKSLKKKKHVQTYLVKHRKYANTANLHILDAQQYYFHAFPVRRIELYWSSFFVTNSVFFKSIVIRCHNSSTNKVDFLILPLRSRSRIVSFETFLFPANQGYSIW